MPNVFASVTSASSVVQLFFKLQFRAEDWSKRDSVGGLHPLRLSVVRTLEPLHELVQVQT